MKPPWRYIDLIADQFTGSPPQSLGLAINTVIDLCGGFQILNTVPQRLAGMSVTVVSLRLCSLQ